MLVRIGNIIVKELIQFERDRLLALFILLAPVLQLILMAQATEKGIKEQFLVVLDQDRSHLSRELVVNLDNTEELWVRYYAQSIEEVRRLLDGDQARLAVIIPVGFAQEVRSASRPHRESGGSRTVQIIADATNSMAASIAIRAASGVASRFSGELPGQDVAIRDAIDLRTHVAFNPTLDVRNFSIPAQVGFITYQVTLAIASLGLARERELGTLEQLMVTPLARLELVLGKALPAVSIGGLNFLVMWAICLSLFKVPMKGSPLLLAILTLVFITAVVGWGLALSTISSTQQQAILFVFIQAMVDITFSGFLVPVKNMPALLQVVAQFVPLQHYLVIIRGIMLKGAGLEALWPQVVALGILSLGIGVIALRSTARRLE